MKLIDTHMHFYDGAWPPGEYESVKIADLLDIMDRYEMEKAWISSLTALVRDPIAANKRLYEFCSQSKGRLMPFYTFNPNYPVDSMYDEVLRCYEKYGAKGIKVHPMLGGFSVSSDEMYKLAGLCAKLGLPMLFHDGTPPYGDPLQIASLGEIHPDLKIILGHTGLADMFSNAISAAEKNSNIYLCFCCTVSGDIEKTVKKISPERLFFGTDFYGIEKYCSYIDNMLDAVMTANIDQKIKEMILYKNALKLIS